MRRRNFNHLSCLDALALNSYGVESCLPPAADSRPPRNANDGEWHTTRFAKPSSIPPDATGFRDMTFVLVNREIADLTRHLSTLETSDLKNKDSLIRQTEISLNEKYLKDIDRSNPSQTIVAAFSEVKLSSLRLTIRHQQSKFAKQEESKALKHS